MENKSNSARYPHTNFLLMKLSLFQWKLAFLFHFDKFIQPPHFVASPETPPSYLLTFALENKRIKAMKY